MVPCEFKASLVYIVSSRPVKAPQLHRETIKKKKILWLL